MHSLRVEDADVYRRVIDYLPAFHPSCILVLSVCQKDKHWPSGV